MDTGIARLFCDACGARHMHGLKCVLAMLDIEADGVHHAIRSGDRRHYGSLVVDIGDTGCKRTVSPLN